MSGNTVFVIGAGASKEVNLRTGLEFKENLAQLLDIRYGDFGDKQEHGDHLIASALFEHVRQPDGRRGDINPYLHGAWKIRDALPLAISIDHVIDAHRDNDKIALCGKLAIVRSILGDEKNSLLYFEQLAHSKMQSSRLEKTWYTPFFQLLTENCGLGNIKERFESITLIIFNYDRCVEHFIYNALQNYYGLSGPEAAEIVKEIKIFHPYGVVGILPWMGQDGAMEFGSDPHPKQLLELSHKIKTFSEGMDPESSEILQIRQNMGVANRVVFLGFAFHGLNMPLITPERVESSSKEQIRCFATTHGISSSDEEVIGKQITDLYQRATRVKMASLTCADFFVEYWRSLSF